MKPMISFLLIVLLTCFFSFNAYSQTLLSGNITSDSTLTIDKSPYKLSASLYVYSSVLTIESGVEIDFNGKIIYIGYSSKKGTINASGVSFLNTYSADKYILFNYLSGGTINGCVFDNVFIKITSGSPAFENCTIKNVEYPLSLNGLDAYPVISNITLSGVTTGKIGLDSGFDITKKYTLKKYELDYFLLANISVYGDTLSIENNTVIDFKSYYLNLGTTNKPGFINADNVTFSSSVTTDKYIGYNYGSGGLFTGCLFDNVYHKIDTGKPVINNSTIKNVDYPYVFQDKNADIDFENITYENALYTKIGLSGSFAIDSGFTLGKYDIGYKLQSNIYCSNGTITFASGISMDLNNYHLYIGKSGLPANLITDNAVFTSSSSSDTYIKFDYLSTGTVSNCAFDNVYISIANASPSVYESNFINADKGIENTGTNIINAENNFWGDSSGPVHLSNPDGKGVIVSNNVDFTPWLTAYNFPGIISPSPSVTIENIQAGLCTGETGVINFKVANSGGNAGDTYLDISLSDNIEVTGFSPSALWEKFKKGSTIYQKTDVTSPTLVSNYLLYEMHDTSFGAGEKTYSLNVKRISGGETWIKYRAAMNPSGVAQSYSPDSFSRYPVKGGTDQQGWYALTENIREPLGLSISSLSRKSGFIYIDAVIDTFGANYYDLVKSNFSVYENNIKQDDYFEVLPPNSGGGIRLADIVFIMDNSGSMSNEQDSVRVNVTNFVNNLQATGIDFALGLCRYGESGDPIIEDMGILTKDPSYFKNDVWNRNITSGGVEKGYYAVKLSSSGFSFHPGAKKVFIMITDETPDQGITKLPEALSICETNDISLYVLTLEALFAKFQPITSVTNGSCFNIYSTFDTILSTISTQISCSYRIKYKSNNPEIFGKENIVELRATYNGKTAVAVDSYIIGAEPEIVRTQSTKDIHLTPLTEYAAIKIEAKITDHYTPFVKSAVLNYRKTGTTSFKSVTMTAENDSVYYADIPTIEVRSPGVDYYITATDGENTSADPAEEPLLNAYQIAVLPNIAPLIVHTPVILSEAGKPITITAKITDTTLSLKETYLYYKKAGQLTYIKSEMTFQPDSTYKAVIPSSYVTTEGVEYYILAKDNFLLAGYAGTSGEPYQITVSSQSINSATLTGVIGGPSFSDIGAPENGEGYVYFSMLSGTDSLSYDGDIDIHLIKTGGQVVVTGNLVQNGLLRITVSGWIFGADSVKVLTTPSGIALGNTLYSITSQPLTITAVKEKMDFERTWDVFAGGSAGVSGTVGSVGAGPSAAAAKLSVKGEAGMGLQFKLDKDRNLFMTRRIEAGIGAGVEVPSINLGVQEVGITGLKAQLMDKALLGQTLCFSDLNLSDDDRKMAQTGFILETLSVGGISLSPIVGIVLTAVVETLNGLSGSTAIFLDAQDEIFFGFGVEGSVGAGVEMNLGDVLKLTFAEATAGFALNAKYTERYGFQSASKNSRSYLERKYLKPTIVQHLGKTLEVTQAANFGFTAVSFGPKVDDGVELSSGNFSLFDGGVGAEAGYSADYDNSNNMEKLEVSLKGGGDVAIFGAQRSKYYSTSIVFPGEYQNVIKESNTGLSMMAGGLNFVRLGPTAMVTDGIDAMEYALTHYISKPITVTTSECRGTGYELSIGLDLEAALGVGLGLQLGVNGKYFDEIQYPRKITELYPGDMNYLISSAEYNNDMASDEFSDILEEILEGTIPLVKNAIINALNIFSDILEAGEEIAAEVINDAGEVVGDIAGTFEDAGEFIVSVFSPDIDLPDIFKPAGNRPVRHMYYSTRVVHKVYGTGKIAELVPSGTILVVVSDAMNIGFKPKNSSASVDTLKSDIDLNMVIYKRRLEKYNFTESDKKRVKLYYFDKTLQSWVREGGSMAADTLTVKTKKMGTYALGIEIENTKDTTPPDILDYGPTGTAKSNKPEIYAVTKDDRYGKGIDFSKTFFVLNNSDTLTVSHDPVNDKIYFNPPESLKKGTYDIKVVVTDYSGNYSVKEFTFNIETDTRVDENQLVFKVDPPYPNPFNLSTVISYQIPDNCHVDLIIYDILGGKVAVLENSIKKAGSYKAVWKGIYDKGETAGTGIYIYRLKAGKHFAQGKFTLIK